MDWKREAMDKLRGYEARRCALTNIPVELRRLELERSRIRGASVDAAPVSGGGSTWEDAMLSNIVQRDELKQRLWEARLWVFAVDKALEVLDDDERLVLDRFYIHRARKALDSLCEQLCVEKTTVYRLRDQALRRVTIALYGVTESV